MSVVRFKRRLIVAGAWGECSVDIETPAEVDSEVATVVDEQMAIMTTTSAQEIRTALKMVPLMILGTASVEQNVSEVRRMWGIGWNRRSSPMLKFLIHRFISRDRFYSCINSCTGHFFVMDWPLSVFEAGVIIMVRLIDYEWTPCLVAFHCNTLWNLTC